jgi:hypothetical protein
LSNARTVSVWPFSAQFTDTLDFGSRRGRTETRPAPEAGVPIPRIARLLALAIRMEELVRERKIRDYAEAARLGRVTRRSGLGGAWRYGSCGFVIAREFRRRRFSAGFLG